jgi:uncharacterized protein YdeI (BOF family)
MKLRYFTLALASTALFGIQTAAAQTNEPLAAYEDDAQIIVSGTVSNLSDDEFVLNVDGNAINVDFGEWDLLADPNLRNYMQNGQNVVVSGEVDKDWFSDDEIEAENIYFSQNYSYYYIDDSQPAYNTSFSNNNNAMTDGSYVSTRGEITEISGREMTINSDGTSMKVDTAEMDYNPMAQELGMGLEVGDRVFVTGQIDDAFFDSKELSAESLIVINQASRGTTGNRAIPTDNQTETN